MRGVLKGALTQEEADKKWQEWIDAKESKIAARREAAVEEIANMHAARFGDIPVIVEETPAEEAPAEEAAEAPAEEATEEATAEAEAPAEEAAAEEAPAEEEKKDEE